MIVRFRPIIPKLPDLDLSKIAQQELEKEAKTIQRELGYPTKTWKRKVTFEIDHATDKQVQVSTDDKVYEYLDKGTKPHIIRPKRAKRLHFFASGFVAKTRVGILNARAGRKATKDETFAQEVHHPGIRARKWSKLVRERSKLRFQRNIQKAIKLALARKK